MNEHSLVDHRKTRRPSRVAAAAFVAWAGLGCAGASPTTETSNENGEADTHVEARGDADTSGSVEAGESAAANDLSAYLLPVREMLDALAQHDAEAVLEAFSPEARSDIGSRMTGYLNDPDFAASFRETLEQLIASGRLVRADAATARIAVPIRYGPALNLVQSDGRWYVEDTSETSDNDFPGELPEETD